MTAQAFQEDRIDGTKVVTFDVGTNVPTGTTLGIIMPNRSGTLFDAASNAVTATGNLTSTDVQAALVELQTDIDALTTSNAADNFIATAADPVAADGVDGDYHINVVSGAVTGPKAAGAYPATGNQGNAYSSITVGSATEAAEGLVELATAAEIQTAAAGNLVVTANALGNTYNSAVVGMGSALLAHDNAGGFFGNTSLHSILEELGAAANLGGDTDWTVTPGFTPLRTVSDNMTQQEISRALATLLTDKIDQKKFV